jgi:hypothetical protein
MCGLCVASAVPKADHAQARAPTYAPREFAPFAQKMTGCGCGKLAVRIRQARLNFTR